MKCWFRVANFSWMSKTSQTHHVYYRSKHLPCFSPELPFVQPAHTQLMETTSLQLPRLKSLEAPLIVVSRPASNQSEDQACFIYLSDAARIWPFLSACTISTTIWAAIISSPDWCNSLLTGLPAALSSIQLIPTTARRILFMCKLVRSPCWLSSPSEEKARFKLTCKTLCSTSRPTSHPLSVFSYAFPLSSHSWHTGLLAGPLQ